MSEPLISIIVPVYNVEKYLSNCLDSIVNQTYKNIEIICVNNGSSDKSKDILEQYSVLDKRIKMIHQENNGVSMARNVALDMAVGSYIMFVDSDDWIEKDTCKIALKTLERQDADVVMWDYIREFPGISKPKNIFDADVVFEGEVVKDKLHRRMIGIKGVELKKPENADALCTIWGKLYKRECIYNNNIRFYDIRDIGTYEDGLFNLDIFAYANKVVYIRKYLYHYRKDNANSLTSIYNDKLRIQHERIHEYMRKYIHTYNLEDGYQIALNNRVALSLVGYGINILNMESGRIKEIKKILSEEKYKKAYNSLEFNYLPLHWKVFYGCARYNFALGIYILLKCINKFIGR